jgi:hypothetical protein
MQTAQSSWRVIVLCVSFLHCANPRAKIRQNGAFIMAVASCPKCKTRIVLVAGEQPVCPGCGTRFKLPAAKPEPVAIAAAIGADDETMPPVQARPIQLLSPEPAPTPFPVVASNAPAEDSPSTNAYESPAIVNTWRTKFEPRQYPAMRIIIVVLYVFAALVGCSFALSSVLMIIGIVTGASRTLDQSAGMAAFGAFTGVFVLLSSLIVHGFFAVLFMASAESIRVWLDIQQNTQEAVFLARSRNWS